MQKSPEELSEIVRESQKLLDLFYFLGPGPFAYGCDLVRVDLYALGRHNVPEVLDLGSIEMALGFASDQLVLM